MINEFAQQEVVETHGAAGGQGTIAKRIVFTPTQMGGRSRLFARVTLPPGATIGEHPHDRDAEVYYVLEGTPLATDDERTLRLSPGDALFTADGHRHSIANDTETDIVFLAVILP